ncbi:MAG: phosphodiesterase/alkaline phosphatase D-like protein, partial [Litorivivens sp.]
MTYPLSRRRFLGGSAIVAGAIAGSVIPMAASQAAMMPALK